jgi:hypothetical protein
LSWAGKNQVTDKLSMTSPLVPLASNDLLDCVFRWNSFLAYELSYELDSKIIKRRE